MIRMNYKNALNIYDTLFQSIKDIETNLIHMGEIVDGMVANEWKGEACDRYKKMFSWIYMSLEAYLSKAYYTTDKIYTSVLNYKRTDAKVVADLPSVE